MFGDRSNIMGLLRQYGIAQQQESRTFDLSPFGTEARGISGRFPEVGFQSENLGHRLWLLSGQRHAPSGPAVWTFARPSTALDRGYSGSGRGSLNHGGVADHLGWRAPTCLNLFAQKCHRVLTGRAPGGVAPLWE